MIFILCASSIEADDAFDCFVDYMEHNKVWELRSVYDVPRLVITDDDLRYMFIKRGYEPYIDDGTSDLIDADDFFNDIINEYYYGR